MNKEALAETIASRFEGMFEPELMQELVSFGTIKQFPENQLLIDIGEYIDFLPLILSGSLKVMTEDEEGRELLLYYLEPGETCAVTMNCCSQRSKSKIRAITESACEVLFIPIQKVEDWMGRFRSWRNFILETYDYRLNEMLKAIDSLAFQNMQDRLYQYLRDKAMVTGSKNIHYTQLEVANDLHSSRVVISRLLKKLEEEGLISHKRNTIELLKL